MQHDPAFIDDLDDAGNPILSKVSRLIDLLPGLSTTVIKVLDTCNNPNASANDLNRVISLDPVLTGRVLNLVNSAYYGLPHRISSVTRAVVLLGINTVKQLALSLAILENFYDRSAFPAFSADEFWTHSLCVAAAAKSLAVAKGLPFSDHEEYFVAGLLHDLGKIPLHKCAPQEGAEAVKLACEKGWSLPEAEMNVMGVDHGMVGNLIAKKWRLSTKVTESLGHHHEPEAVDEERRPFVQMVSCANRFANIGRIGFAGDCAVSEPQQESLLTTLGLDEGILEALHAAVSDEYEKATVFLQVASGRGGYAT